MNEQQNKTVNAICKYVEDATLLARKAGRWDIAGQQIVYGLERSLGFTEAVDLCGVVERLYKKGRTMDDASLAAAANKATFDWCVDLLSKLRV